ncbi:MAG: hypothetical protein Q4E75_02095 [bacterium]|nr:hypothetical protein [bacterium]
MAKKYSINITNGTGSNQVVNGSYDISLVSNGYDISSIDPKSITVNGDTDTFDFTVAATGSLTLHVTDTGLDTGTPIEGATFYRCDSLGTTYGDAITTNELGNAVFNNVPFAENNAPKIYYKQTASDGSHNFDDTLKNTTLTTQTKTEEIQNSVAVSKTFNLTDANYSGLKVETAEIELNQ